MAAAAAAVPLAGAGFAAGLGEVCGLKKSASVFFAGEADGLTAGEAAAVAFVFRAGLAAGEGETAAPAGDGEASVVVFAFRPRLAVGEGEASGPAA